MIHVSDDIRKARKLLEKARAKVQEATQLTGQAADLLAGSKEKQVVQIFEKQEHAGVERRPVEQGKRV